MSLVKRTLSAAAGKANTGSVSAFPRAIAVTCAVVGGWLAVNVAAYGGLALPEGGEGLLAERTQRPLASASQASLPATPFFGVAEVRADLPTELDLENIPNTQLNLVLSGVLSSSVNDRASALVAEKGKPAQRVFVGETLSGGAEVYAVEVDHIILRRNGEMEKLTYPDVDGRPTVPKQYASYTRQAARAINANAAGGSEDKQQSIRERLEQLREMARQRQQGRGTH